ncbi:ribosome maturation factor RimM [Actinospica robiniae]|uniref:ribosome maturation factor RimM n=1 Tax=Actinospica robiniae TaxID=304901 RepID=UPI0005544A1F
MRLVVGRIGKAHGVKGEVTVEVRTDDPDLRFAAGAELLTEPAARGPLTVSRGRVQGGRLVLSFEGVHDRNGAEALRNTMLVAEVDPDELPDDPDEYYDHQLEGLAVRTVQGEELGVVEQMIHGPAQDLFSIRRPDGGELLLPFIEEFVPEVDLERGLVIADPPEGLLELSEPAPAAPEED